MVCLPPGSAKSTYGSKLFPAWFLAQRPYQNIIGAANTADLAIKFSRGVMQHVRDHSAALGYSLTRDAAEDWQTSNGGAYRAAGVGGTITGTRADVAIIDDAIRSAEEANSEVVREKQWDWFTNDLRTRLKPGASIVIIGTRWHEDDLSGRLLSRQRELWDVVSLPAIAGENDPLGRKSGEYLWSDDDYRYADDLRAAHAEAEMSGAMRTWGALYQQDPRPAEGALFKTHMVTVLPAAPVGTNAVRAWDLAATKQTGSANPDWTVGVKLLRTNAGGYVVLDVVRLRGGPDEVQHAIVNTAHQDGLSVRINLPQDPGQAGKAQVLSFTQSLAGFRVESSPETGDKATRAAPVASQVNVGNVSLVKADWNASFLDELSGFPNASKDDQVDALSRAFSVVGLAQAPLNINPAAVALFSRRR